MVVVESNIEHTSHVTVLTCTALGQTRLQRAITTWTWYFGHQSKSNLKPRRTPSLHREGY